MTTFDSGNVEGSFDETPVPAVEFHEQTETYRTEFDFEIQTVSEAVVAAISRACNCNEMELSPLHESVDPDALNTLFTPKRTTEGPTTNKVTFEHAGHVVTVDGRGTVTVKATTQGRAEGTVAF